jgi:hypothetical protein
VQRPVSEIFLQIFGKVSLAQLVGGVDVQTQHLSSNIHVRELRFLFILEDLGFLWLMQFILRIIFLVCSRLKIQYSCLMVVCIPSWCRSRGSEILRPFKGKVSLADLVGGSGCTNPAPEFKSSWTRIKVLFILEDLGFIGLMQFILRTRFLVYSRLKIRVLILNGCMHP